MSITVAKRESSIFPSEAMIKNQLKEKIIKVFIANTLIIDPFLFV